MGFEGLAALPARPGVSKRVMLFTDAVPNVGATDSAGFRALTARYAARNIGLTAFGVGVDFGQELIYHISQLRGGNFFYLESPEKIAKVFDTEFDYLVTPLAYDLDVRIATPAGLKLAAVYGLPSWKPGSGDATLHIPTVFLSSNRGAIVLRYERDDASAPTLDNGDAIAEGTISFTDPDGTPHARQTTLRHGGRARLEPGTQFYTHDGMRMAVALTNVYFGLRDACTLLSEGKRDAALAVLRRARGIATLENLALADEGLAAEVQLLDRLEENIDKGGRVRAGTNEGEKGR
jgi:Ca-activated chloride channel family protein